MVFLFLALASIVISVYLYLTGRREKLPFYYVKTFPLIEDRLGTIKAVEILYKGQRIENLAVTRFALWNKGKDTINAGDVAPRDPLKIILDPQFKLLSAEITFVSTAANNFSVQPDLDMGEVAINFDYFHTYDGVVMQIYHTGKSNEDLKLLGTIKGVTQIPLFSPTDEPLTDSIFLPVVKLLPEPKKMPPGPLRLVSTLLIGVIILVMLPFIILFFLIDKLAKPFRRPKPRREFQLID